MYNKEFQGDVCSHKHAFFLDNFLRRLIQNPKKIVGPYIKSGDTIIDLGCGPGYFSIDMAAMAGKTGRVVCVDLQPEMLAGVEKKARQKNLSDRIRLHQCTQNGIGLEPDLAADFILAFYMVHETPDPRAFLDEVKGLLKPGGKFLVKEPRFHVSKSDFQATLNMARDAGFRIIDDPAQKGGLGALLTI